MKIYSSSQGDSSFKSTTCAISGLQLTIHQSVYGPEFGPSGIRRRYTNAKLIIKTNCSIANKETLGLNKRRGGVY